jgi:hypothetical protein
MYIVYRHVYIDILVQIHRRTYTCEIIIRIYAQIEEQKQDRDPLVLIGITNRN